MGERPEEDVGVTGHTQQSEEPKRKNVLVAATPKSKLDQDVAVDDAWDIYTRDATAAFHERRRGKGRKLYNKSN